MLFFQLKKGNEKGRLLRYGHDRVDLFRNKVEDCPGGRRRYHCNAGIYEVEFRSEVKTPRRFMQRRILHASSRIDV